MTNLNRSVTGVTDEAEAKRLLLRAGIESMQERGGYIPPLDSNKIPETIQAFAKRKKIKLNKPLWQAWVMEEWALLYHTHAIRLSFNFYNAFELEYTYQAYERTLNERIEYITDDSYGGVHKRLKMQNGLEVLVTQEVWEKEKHLKDESDNASSSSMNIKRDSEGNWWLVDTLPF